MEEQANTPPPPTEQPPVSKPSSHRSKWPFVIIGLLVLLLIPLGGYFVLNQTGSSPNATVTPTPTGEAAQTNTTATPTPTGTAMKTFTSEKFEGLSFLGYILKYPTDWSLTEERDDSTSISTVTITKNGYALKVFQAATGGAQCIYEGDMPEGPASDYRTNKYSDLVTGFATLRQTESPSGGKMTYAYCQKNTDDGSFGQPTSVGHMSATTGVASPDPKIVSELEEIVKSIQTLP